MRTFHGLTLVELIVTIAVFAIVLTVGVPSFLELVQNGRLRSANQAMTASLWLARSEAIKRGFRVALCPSLDGLQCSTGASWEQGWIIFEDRNNNNQMDVNEQLLQSSAASEGLTMSASAALANSIAFTPAGRPMDGTGNSQSGAIVFCDSRGFAPHTRALLLSKAGALNTRVASDAGIHDCQL